MILYIVSVKDRVTDIYGQPIYMASLGGAIRSFGDAVNNDEALKKHPEDYDLYHLGEFDDNTAEFVTRSPRMLALGKDLVTKKGE